MGDYHTLRIILGDQLNANHSWFKTREKGVLHLIAELRQETDYVRHHIQKLCAFFAAMDSFAGWLRTGGHHVLHMTLDDTQEFTDLEALLGHLCSGHSISSLEYQRPDEYRLLEQFRSLDLPPSVTIRELDTEHFLLPFNEIPDYFQETGQLRMETFYRKMRRRFGILMDGNLPTGGKWNYDRENRQKLRPPDIAEVPEPILFENSVSSVLERIKRHGVAYFGSSADPLPWPVDRPQALKLLDHFCRRCLPRFGRFQDAMTRNGDYRWTLYHSRLSFALNCKILDPMEVIEAALRSYEISERAVTTAQIEGFVRQILGWREFVRGVYWTHMPAYGTLNRLAASRPLPGFFWTGDTRMTCMREAIGQSLRYAYAHHIQRLMVTGNFCLLAGVDPDQVEQWYLGVYIDAIQWVEMPNTRGMSQYADGGLVASKPYCASANYIRKMSDYCSQCHYDQKDSDGERACPLNCLYWHFMDRHREIFASNPRTGMIYGSWDRQPAEKRRAVLQRARLYLDNLERL